MPLSLNEFVSEACHRLLERADALGGPTDIAEVSTDADDYPEFDQDSDANYDRGLIEGIAAALGMTSLELLDEFEVPIRLPIFEGVKPILKLKVVGRSLLGR